MTKIYIKAVDPAVTGEGPFERAYMAAVAAERAFEQADAAVRRGLSKEAFLKEAMSNAGIDEAGLSTLHEKLTGPGFEAALSGITAIVRSFVDSGIRASRPTKRIRYFWDDPGRAQLGAASVTELAAYSLAVKIATSLHPEAFGSLPNWESGENELRRCQEALAAADAATEKAWGADDVTFGDHGRIYFTDLPSVEVSGKDLGPRVRAAARAKVEARKAA